MKKIFFIVIIGSLLIQFSCNNTAKSNSDKGELISGIGKDVDATEFKALIEAGGGVLVDVRTPGEFSEGYIEGAKNIDFNSPSFQEELGKLDKNKPVYVYCAVGGRSARAMSVMVDMGFTEVYNLIGGYGGWIR